MAKSCVEPCSSDGEPSFAIKHWSNLPWWESDCITGTLILVENSCSTSESDPLECANFA